MLRPSLLRRLVQFVFLRMLFLTIVKLFPELLCCHRISARVAVLLCIGLVFVSWWVPSCSELKLVLVWASEPQKAAQSRINLSQ